MYSNSHHDELEPRPVPRPTQFQVNSIYDKIFILTFIQYFVFKYFDSNSMNA